MAGYNYKDHPSYFQDSSPLQNPNPTMQDNLDDDYDEPEETVSLCDLPIYGYDDPVCSTSDSDATTKGDENFEFFSEEWLKSSVKDSNFYPNETIVFCGNFIPISKSSQEFKKLDQGSKKVDLKSGFDRKPKNNERTNHETKRRVLPVSVSKKSRWYYYGVGLAGIPTEMDMGGIRDRQNRHRKSHSVGTQSGGGKEASGGAKGLGRLIKDFRCNGQHKANSMVKASLVYIPRL